MAYDDVILRMGEFGRYQRRIYVLLCLPAIICAFHKMGGVFLGPKMTTRCLLPWEEKNATFLIDEYIMNASYPIEDRQCLRRVNLTGYVPEGAEGGGNTGSSGDLTRTSSDGIMTCQEFVFDTSIYKSTTTSEWNLVCEKGWLRAFGDSLFMVGVMLGSIIFGGLSDKFGRRPIFFLSLVIQLVGGLLVAIAPEYISYVIFRLIVGSTTSGVFLVAYVIALEMVGPKKRSVAGVGCQLFFTFGYIVTAAFAYYIRDWRYLQIAITLPSFAFLVYWWFIPESARWLLTKGKDEEAKELLQRAAKENGIEIPRDTLDCLLHESNGDNVVVNSQASLFDLFRTPNLRKKSILLFFNWLVNSGTYYGLSWNVNNLGGNDYVNFVILGAVEVPAYLFLIFVLERWGRKSILCGCMVVSGLALVGTIFVPEEYPWMIIVLAMIGKLAITSSYGGIYVFTAEQFPTVVRNVGLGACSTFARIGGVIAPYVNHLAEIWKPLPLVIFGGCALIGGLISLMLPETLNKKLPETIEDGELFGLKDKTSKLNREKHRELKQLDVHHLNDTDSMKPLKPVENGIHDSKQNG